MWEVLAAAAVSVLVGIGVGGFITKRSKDANFAVLLEQAKAKAKEIELEANALLKDTQRRVEQAEFEARKEYEQKEVELQKQFLTKQDKLAKMESNLNVFQKALEGKRGEFEALKTEFFTQKSSFETQMLQEKEELQLLSQNAQLKLDEAQAVLEEGEDLKAECSAKLAEAIAILERNSGLTAQEAKEIVLNKTAEQCRDEVAHIVRRYEEEAKKEAKKRANYIIAQATSRFAGEFAAERLINVVDIKNEELKGRIIGKEGRNIKALEMTLGVDVIVDDTPHAIVLSSFNLYRRAIATRVVELLVADGRIGPSRIEEVYAKVCAEFEESVAEEGENIIMDLGIGRVHPEIVKLIGKLRFRASYGQNALAHSLEVANLAGIIAAECGGNAKLAKRAGLLHDIGKALTHEREGSHVDLGGEICKRYNEHEVVLNAIYAHHGHEEARSVEAAAVCAADALSAARPGARREVLEAYLKRVEEIEAIATSQKGVKNAYAINAGREVRVIANAKLINDDEAVLVAKEIAAQISQNVQFPGEIKVNVIRETRAIEVAK